MHRSENRLLVVGEHVRISLGGTLYRVVRATPCSASLKPRYSAPVEVTIGARTFMATEGGTSIQVSPRAFVYREGE